MDKQFFTDEEKMRFFLSFLNGEISQEEPLLSVPQKQMVDDEIMSQEKQRQPQNCLNTGPESLENSNINYQNEESYGSIHIENQQADSLIHQAPLYLPYEAEKEQMIRIRRMGPKKANSRTSTKKLNNAHKFDYRHFSKNFQKFADDIYQLDETSSQLKEQTREIIKTIGENRITTNSMTSLFSNISNKQAIYLSYLNCKLLKHIFEKMAADIIFSKNKKLANKTTFYLHIWNKYLRVQSLHLSSRLQAR